MREYIKTVQPADYRVATMPKYFQGAVGCLLAIRKVCDDGEPIEDPVRDRDIRSILEVQLKDNKSYHFRRRSHPLPPSTNYVVHSVVVIRHCCSLKFVKYDEELYNALKLAKAYPTSKSGAPLRMATDPDELGFL